MKGPEDFAEGAGEIAEHLDKGFDKMLDSADEATDGQLTGLEGVGELPWPTKGQTFLQLRSDRWQLKSNMWVVANKLTLAKNMARRLSKLGKVTVQKALKSSIEGTVKQVLGCNPAFDGAFPGPAPASAPAPAPAPVGPPQPPSGLALVRNGASGFRSRAVRHHFSWEVQAGPAPVPAAGPAAGPAGGPSPAPASMCQMPKVHVEVLPGHKMKKNHMINMKILDVAQTKRKAPAPQTVKVRVSLFERPGNGINDMAGAKTKLKQALGSGELKARLQVAVESITGIKPKMSHLKVKARAVPRWDMPKCANHMSAIVKTFTVHYTRKQVPMALLNACSDFMTKMSFSHDYVMDRRDDNRCRTATKSFAKRWKFGKKDNPNDFEAMCERFCQAKYGDDSPQCHTE